MTEHASNETRGNTAILRLLCYPISLLSSYFPPFLYFSIIHFAAAKMSGTNVKNFFSFLKDVVLKWKKKKKLLSTILIDNTDAWQVLSIRRPLKVGEDIQKQ